jgi:hypothetical protein
MHEAFGSDYERVRNLELPLRSFYKLAAPSTPEAARADANGENFTHAQIKEMIDEARANEAEALEQAIAADGI